jgi:DNA polymerase III delta prime subunit
MFENIIGNLSTISIIKKELSKGIFPRASLLYGPAYTGKLSTALEIARVLVCEKKTALWSCDCYQCKLNKELLHPYITLLGFRYFNTEITACGDVLKRVKKPASRFLFIRAVRKLTRRFDPVIWEGEEGTFKRVREIILEIEELLDSLGQEAAFLDDQLLIKIIGTVINLASKLTTFLSTDNIPINFIRKAIQWAHLSSPGPPKILILENAENMLESSRNATLKILEEPPPNVYLILTVTRLANLIPTIRSRLRRYKFLERQEAEVKDILSRIFHEESLDFSSLRSYFLAWQEINLSMIANLAKTFFQKVVDVKTRNIDILNEMQELFSSQETKKIISLFVQELLLVLSNLFHKKFDLSETEYQMPDTSRLKHWVEIIGKRYQEHNTLNLQAQLFVQNLFYQMKA